MDTEKFRQLFYSLNDDDFEQAKLMLKDGIPDELIYDVVAVYLNCNSRDDRHSQWSPVDRRTLLKSIYAKFIPTDIKTVVKPYLAGVSPGQNMGGKAPYWDAVLIFREASLDTRLLIEAYTRITFIDFRTHGEHWRPVFEKLDTIPRAFALDALYIWSSLPYLNKKKAFHPGLEKNMVQLYGQSFVSDSIQRQYSFRYAMLGIPLLINDLNLDVWFSYYWWALAVPCDDYPQELLSKAAEVANIRDIEISPKYSPRLRDDSAAQAALAEQFGARVDINEI